MLTRHGIVLLVSLVIPAFGQTNTTLNLSTQGRNADFSNFPFTRPLTQGSSLPSTCQVGQLFFNTAAPIGANIYSCASPNTWAGVGSGYANALAPATATTLGGVTVSCLSWKWRERSAVKITGRTHEEATEALQRRRESRHSEAAFA
ncbi:MAG: hypothetical protein ACR2IV_17810, partial [Bryobacteraceae bacterium]